jgi:geranylgeranyl reductase family protein
VDVYDVVIVGGSVGGLSCAIATRHRTLVIEKRAAIGDRVVCGEYVPLPFLGLADVPPAAVAARVDRLRTFLGEDCVERRWPGAILDRGLWEQCLYEEARGKGVDFWFGCRARALFGDTLTAEHSGSRLQVRGRFFVGADGPRSAVGRSIGATNRRFLPGFQYRVPAAQNLCATEVYMNERYQGGYGWLFPRGHVANVGIGAHGLKSPWRHLDVFVDRLHRQGKVGSTVLERVGGPIPVGGLLDRISSGCTVLVGDAAGLTNPMTGAGIHQAYWSGRLAGRTARSYLEGDTEAAERYDRQVRKYWEPQLARDRQRRGLMEDRWDEDFEEAVRKTWIAFR